MQRPIVNIPFIPSRGEVIDSAEVTTKFITAKTINNIKIPVITLLNFLFLIAKAIK